MRQSLRFEPASEALAGILAFAGDQPVGWCAVAPRQEYVTLAQSRVLRPLDDAPVWSVSCFFIAKPFRRQGLSVRLLKAAIAFVKQHGGKILEGYPMPRWSESRPIMRYVVRLPAH